MSSHQSKVSSALQPKNQSSPFGSLSVNSNGVSYNPKYQSGQQSILSQAPTNEANLLTNDIPKATDQYTGQVSNYLGNINNLTSGNMINQGIYDAMYAGQANPLLSQYHQNVNNLNNELAMKNLSGGSYDALAHGQLDKNLGLDLTQIANNAELGGLQATGDYLGWQQQGANTAGTQLGALGESAQNDQNLSSGLQTQLFQPFTDYTQYQQVVNPLQQAQAQYDWQTPTGFQQVMGRIGNSMNSIVPGLGDFSGFTTAANAFGNPGAASLYPSGGNGHSFLGTVLGNGGIGSDNVGKLASSFF